MYGHHVITGNGKTSRNSFENKLEGKRSSTREQEMCGHYVIGLERRVEIVSEKSEGEGSVDVACRKCVVIMSSPPLEKQVRKKCEMKIKQ